MELLIAVLLLSIIVNTSCQSPSPTAQSLDDLINEIFEMNLNGMVAPTEVPPAIISTSSSTSSPTTTTAAVNVMRVCKYSQKKLKFKLYKPKSALF